MGYRLLVELALLLVACWTTRAGPGYLSPEEARQESMRRCYKKILSSRQRLQRSIDAAESIIGALSAA